MTLVHRLPGRQCVDLMRALLPASQRQDSKSRAGPWCRARDASTFLTNPNASSTCVYCFVACGFRGQGYEREELSTLSYQKLSSWRTQEDGHWEYYRAIAHRKQWR